MFSNDCWIKMFIHSFYFLLLFISLTKVKLIQVVIVYLIISSSSIFIWSFSHNICVVACWPVCSQWSYNRSSILKLLFGCDWKLSVGHIQTVHVNLLPPQFFRRSWRFLWLVVQTCLLQFISLLELKSPLSSSSKISFVDCWLLCIMFIGSAFVDPETCPWLWLKIFSGVYQNCTYAFASPAYFWKVVQGWMFYFDFTCCNQYIYWLQGSYYILSFLVDFLAIDL